MEFVNYESVNPNFELYHSNYMPFIDFSNPNSPNYNVGTSSDIYDDLLNDSQLYNLLNDYRLYDTDITHIGNFNVEAAINELHTNVNYHLKSRLGRITSTNVSLFKKKDPYKSGHKCGVSVRLALLAGGLNISNGGSGGSYGRYLELAGWQKLPVDSAPQKGDIAVTTPFGKHKSGHVSMFDGQRWVSDFILRDILVYGLSSAAHTSIYRYRG